jgi:putative ABC transport system ATP-binding protein
MSTTDGGFAQPVSQAGDTTPPRSPPPWRDSDSRCTRCHQVIRSGPGRFDALKGRLARDLRRRVCGHRRQERLRASPRSCTARSTEQRIHQSSPGSDAVLHRPEPQTPRNRTFGFVFQQFFLTGGASVLENMIPPAQDRGRRLARAANGAVSSTLAALEAGGQAVKPVTSQKQRASLVIEPTGNLDSATGAVVEDIPSHSTGIRASLSSSSPRRRSQAALRSSRLHPRRARGRHRERGSRMRTVST